MNAYACIHTRERDKTKKYQLVLLYLAYSFVLSLSLFASLSHTHTASILYDRRGLFTYFTITVQSVSSDCHGVLSHTRQRQQPSLPVCSSRAMRVHACDIRGGGHDSFSLAAPSQSRRSGHRCMSGACSTQRTQKKASVARSGHCQASITQVPPPPHLARSDTRIIVTIIIVSIHDSAVVNETSRGLSYRTPEQ